MTVINPAGGGVDRKFDKTPNECPHCHRTILPQSLSGVYCNESRSEIFFVCVHPECQRGFLGIYVKNDAGVHCLKETSIGTLTTSEFTSNILNLSPKFDSIYNQVNQAECFHLNEIAGIGYRKAIEFLIKDYLISLHPEKTEEIKGKFLGSCIKDDVKDARIKAVASRAVWLGNDETHYVRIWESKDLEDLKKLIELTLHWIEMEKLTEEYLKHMPEKK